MAARARGRPRQVYRDARRRSVTSPCVGGSSPPVAEQGGLARTGRSMIATRSPALISEIHTRQDVEGRSAVSTRFERWAAETMFPSGYSGMRQFSDSSVIARAGAVACRPRTLLVLGDS
jgi:hypothetical protein